MLGTGFLALEVAAGGTLADTYIVDDDGGVGVDFTDIPPALIVATPGDVILVQPGNDSSFVLTEGLTASFLGHKPRSCCKMGPCGARTR